MELQGFDIDACALAAGTPGVGVLEYAALDELETESYEPAVDETYVHRRTLSGTFHALPFVVGSGAFTEESQPQPQGVTYRQSLTVFLPGDDKAVRDELNRMRHRRFIVRMTGRDSRTLLIGTPEQPMRFESRFTTGPQGGDQRGHECRFQGNALRKSPEYIPAW